MEGGYITGSHPYALMAGEETSSKRARIGGLALAGTTALAGFVPQVRDYVVETAKAEVRRVVRRKLQDVKNIFTGSFGDTAIIQNNNNIPFVNIWHPQPNIRPRKYFFESIGNNFPLFT